MLSLPSRPHSGYRQKKVQWHPRCKRASCCCITTQRVPAAVVQSCNLCSTPRTGSLNPQAPTAPTARSALFPRRQTGGCSWSSEAEADWVGTTSFLPTALGDAKASNSANQLEIRPRDRASPRMHDIAEQAHPPHSCFLRSPRADRFCPSHAQASQREFAAGEWEWPDASWEAPTFARYQRVAKGENSRIRTVWGRWDATAYHLSFSDPARPTNACVH